MQSLFQKIKAGVLWPFHGGVHPPSRKQTTNQRPIAVLPLPDKLYIPLRQHIGVAGQLLVEPGERVLKGQALTSADNSMAVPVHAPTSGTVLAIEQHTSPHPSALPEPTLVLIPDGQDEWRERIALNLSTADNQSILARIQDSGIAGLGGAGFPTHLKAGITQPVDYLIINAVECEPYITADDLLMQEAATTIVKGIDILCQLLSPKAVLIGIEDDKPIAAAAMQAACNQREHYLVREVPTRYPSGGEKQLIQLLTGKEVPHGRRPVDIGIVMQNVGTAFAIAQAVLDDHPLINRVVTVAGDTLTQPQNVLALLGTPVSTLLQACGFSPEPAQRVIMGGPMMGFTLPDLSVPIVKTTNCILAPAGSELPAAQNETDCIRCGACADVCPAVLLPQQLLWYSKAKDSEKLKEYNLADCIECGACAYVCPSEIPLVQYYRVAKAEIREQQHEALKAEQAKARFEARNARLEQEKLQRQKRNEELAAARAKSQQSNDKQQAVAQALARIKASTGAAKTEEPGRTKEQVLAERERKKQQAREYQAQKQQQVTEDNAIGDASDKADTTENKAGHVVPSNVDTPAPAATASPAAKNAAVAAAIARAKAKKAAQTEDNPSSTNADSAQDTVKDVAQPSVEPNPRETIADTASKMDAATADPRKAAIAAAIARAKAKQMAVTERENGNTHTELSSAEPSVDVDPRKAAIAAAIARAKAKKQADSESS